MMTIASATLKMAKQLLHGTALTGESSTSWFHLTVQSAPVAHHPFSRLL